MEAGRRLRKSESRIVAHLFAVMFILVAISSCAYEPIDDPAGSPSYDLEIYGDLESVNPSRQVVVFWYPHTQGHEKLLLELVDEFNTSNRWNIAVLGEHAGSTEAISQKIQRRADSGVLPGITVAQPHQIAAYVAQGTAVDLQPYVKSERWGYSRTALNDFYPAAPTARTLPHLEGSYGWPPYRSAEVLYYNEDWLIELGYTTPPQTWEEFREIACMASDPDAGTYGYALSNNASTFANMTFTRGGQIIDTEAAVYSFDSRESLETLTFIQELIHQGCAVPETERSGDRAGFAAGSVLFTIDDISSLSDYRRAVVQRAGFNWSIAPLPTSLDAPVVYVQGPAFLISRSTPEEQLAAWLFLKWFTEPEQQARWVRAFNYVPVRLSTVDLLQEYFEENPQYEKAVSLMEYDVALEPGVIQYAQCRDSIRRMLTAVSNREDAETWLNNTVQECNDILEAANQESD